MSRASGHGANGSAANGQNGADAAGGSYVALCGGVGGAKLALGLAHVLPPGKLTIIVNTGDDFEHAGLHISPDIDTVLYTLAGLANAEQGWGLAGETWNFMGALERLGGPTWFRLGDQDLATHVERSARLKRGATLTAVTDHLRRRLRNNFLAPRFKPNRQRTVFDPRSFCSFANRRRPK